MTLDELLAREAIRDTMGSYNVFGDRGLIEAYAATFTEDGVLDGPMGPLAGREAIVRFVREVAVPRLAARTTGSTAPLRHNLTTSRIEITGPAEARATTYFFLLRAGQVEESGIYVDRFAKVGEQWLIAHRRIKLEWELFPDSYR